MMGRRTKNCQQFIRTIAKLMVLSSQSSVSSSSIGSFGEEVWHDGTEAAQILLIIHAKLWENEPNPKYLAEVLVHCLCFVEVKNVCYIWHGVFRFIVRHSFLVFMLDSAPLSVGIESSLHGIQFFMLENNTIFVYWVQTLLPQMEPVLAVLWEHATWRNNCAWSAFLFWVRVRQYKPA